MREGEGEEREPGERTGEPRMEAEARKKKTTRGGKGEKKTIKNCGGMP